MTPYPRATQKCGASAAITGALRDPFYFFSYASLSFVTSGSALKNSIPRSIVNTVILTPEFSRLGNSDSFRLGLDQRRKPKAKLAVFSRFPVTGVAGE
jgi:hypothetical protein